MREETSYDTEALAASIPERESSLNDEQREIYDSVIESVEQDEGKVFAVQAPGGTGKTYILNLVLDKIRSEGDIALATALSGIASVLLVKTQRLIFLSEMQLVS